ncbi:MAG: L-threonylcarbamoyladenylate synthase [Gammaproteobacteria bacterium]
MTTIPDINKAVSILQQGGLVALPTETVYGLGADATNPEAVRRIFLAKERPEDHPLIVHLAHFAQLGDWARDISPAALKLAEAFWPGPLTMILKKQPHVLDIVTGSQDTVGLRIPGHPVARALLEAFGGGIAAPSANKFTHISPTTASAVFDELGEEVDLILDGGACEVGLESTIVDMTSGQPVILRPGMITAEAIEAVLNVPVASAAIETATKVPGMHHLHYAPITKTSLIEHFDIPLFLQTIAASDLPVVLMVRNVPLIPMTDQVFWVKMPSDPKEYAHDLYRTLRSLDSQQYQRIIIENVPNERNWCAIADRLKKATGSVC